MFSSREEVRSPNSNNKRLTLFVSPGIPLSIKSHCMDLSEGRSKNLWESPPGCLMFSFTIQMEDGRTVPLLQYVISLAITEAIKDICDKEVILSCFWPVLELLIEIFVENGYSIITSLLVENSDQQLMLIYR